MRNNGARAPRSTVLGIPSDETCEEGTRSLGEALEPRMRHGGASMSRIRASQPRR